MLNLLEKHDLLVSPMVVLELKFLFEIGRLKVEPMKVLSSLQKTIGLAVCNDAFSITVYEAMDLDWTRDPFDRIIVANASVFNAKLMSKDASILKNYAHAVW